MDVIQERYAKKLKSGHYVAKPNMSTYASANRGYSPDIPDSRPPSEFTLTNERNPSPPQAPTRKGKKSKNYEMYSNSGISDGPLPLSSPPSRLPPRAPSALSYDHGGDTGSDIYVTSAVYKPASDIGRYHTSRTNHTSPRSLYSVASTHRSGKSKSSRKMGAKVDTMSAPNPFCPNIRGMCCLMLLINLGLILTTLGFLIVLQIPDPFIIVFLGIVFLIFGLITLIGSILYCSKNMEFRTPKQVRNEDLYWTKHWSKSIGYTPQSEINYKSADERDRFSDHYSVSKLSGKYSDLERESNRY
jgi:hypothetical protein